MDHRTGRTILHRAAVWASLAAASGTAVVLVRDPGRQIFAIAGNGLVLTLLFTALQAPDVALSELAVGVAAVPLLFLAALMAVRAGRPEAGSGGVEA